MLLDLNVADVRGVVVVVVVVVVVDERVGVDVVDWPAMVSPQYSKNILNASPDLNPLKVKKETLFI